MQKKSIIIVGLSALALTACSTAAGFAPAASLTPSATATAPAPIDGNSGKFMSPYTSDEVVAEWVDKAMTAKMGASLGSTAGRLAGEKALESVPFVGGFLGARAGKSMGRAVALNSVGGEEFLKSSSDLSFNNLNDMSVFLFVEHSHRENYKDVLAATMEIYPDLKTVYSSAIRRAAA